MTEVSAGTLTDFLLRRIAEDEALGGVWSEMGVRGEDRAATEAEDVLVRRCRDAFERRVLAECEAKRRIVALCSGAELAGAYRTMPQVWTGEQWMATGATDHVLLLLALPYAGHAEFNPAWRL